MYTELLPAELRFPEECLARLGQIKVIEAQGLPNPHEAEAPTFARHKDIPGHNQAALSAAQIAMVGAGGPKRSGCPGFPPKRRKASYGHGSRSGRTF